MRGRDASVKRNLAIHAATQKCKWRFCFESVLREVRVMSVARVHGLFESETMSASVALNGRFMSAERRDAGSR